MQLLLIASIEEIIASIEEILNHRLNSCCEGTSGTITLQQEYRTPSILVAVTAH